jgi:Neocarzinostatin family
MARTIITLGLAIAIAASAPAMASGPRAKPMPNKQLTAGQVLTVTGRGFPPYLTMYIVQCNRDVATFGEDACNINNYVQITTTRKGLVPATLFTVQTGAIGNGSCGTGTRDRKCYIVISTEDLTQHGRGEVLFAAP